MFFQKQNVKVTSKIYVHFDIFSSLTIKKNKKKRFDFEIYNSFYLINKNKISYSNHFVTILNINQNKLHPIVIRNYNVKISL